MSKVELLPVDQWIQPIDGCTEVQLREANGASYNPNGVPAWLGRVGLNYLQNNADAIKLTLLYGMQQTAEDLGAPGELEELAKTAVLLGDDILDDRQGTSYRQRRYDAIVKKGIPIFNTATCWDEQTVGMAKAITDAMYDRAESAALLGEQLGAFDNPEAARKERVAQTAAGILAIHALDWMLLQSTGEMLARRDQKEGEQHVVISLPPFQLDVARKAQDILGLGVDARLIGEDTWPTDAFQESFMLRASMATGKFDTALV